MQRKAEEALRAAAQRLAEAQAAFDDLDESASESENEIQGDINISISGVAGAHGLVVRGRDVDTIIAAVKEQDNLTRVPSGDINISISGHAGRGFRSIHFTN